MTGHKCKLPEIKRSRPGQIWTCSCGREYNAVRYTCPCGTFGCRDAWQWIGLVESPVEAEPVEVFVEVEDDATE